MRFTPRRDPASEIVLIGFSDGPFVYFESSNRLPRVNQSALERDVVSLYRRVRGRPAPNLPLAD